MMITYTKFTYKNRKGISVEVYAPQFDEDPSTTLPRNALKITVISGI